MKKALPLLLIPVMLMAAGCDGDTSTNQAGSAAQSAQSGTVDTSTTQAGQSQAQSTTVAATTASTPFTCPMSNDAQLAAPKSTDTVAIMDTDFGTIKIKLFTKDVPELTKNFIELAKAGKYDGTPFHRVVQDFMIQGGDFTNKDGTGGYSYKGPGTQLPNEIVPTLHHLCGTVSMAKTSAPVSIGSQFFIVTNKAGTPFLDGGYSPIGQVYEGMEVAGKIQDLQMPGTEQPSQTVNVKKVTIETFAADQKAKK